MGRGSIGASVGPSSRHRLDEALGLAIGAWRVGPRENLADAVRLAERTEVVRAVAPSVVGEDAFDPDSETREALDHVAQEAGRARSVLARMHFRVSQSGAVIDGDEGRLPASASRPLAAIAVDAVPDPLDPRELLGIDVHQRTRLFMLVAARRRGLRFDSPKLAESDLQQDARDGGSREMQFRCDLDGSELPLATQLLDALHQTRRCLPRRPVRPRRLILEMRRGFKPSQPLVDGLAADAEFGRCLSHGSALLPDPADHQCTAVRVRPRVTMQVHPGVPL